MGHAQGGASAMGQAGWLLFAFGLGAAVVGAAAAPAAVLDVHDVRSSVVSVDVRVAGAEDGTSVAGADVALWFATGYRHEHGAGLEVVPLGRTGADGRLATALTRTHAVAAVEHEGTPAAPFVAVAVPGERVFLEIAAPGRERVLREIGGGRFAGTVSLHGSAAGPP
ncbi:MAG TPA: hypothetical protein VG389_13485 [Myxococcota bacterium]|jgi:hypothetical protein|nr:hypothetical protein [Myxococcota bacterium]